MPSLFRRLLLLSFAFAAAGAARVRAQSNAEINSGIQFNFSSPGARSLSLGGAFLGLADDATAAYTNPAGLTNLTRPELSAEGRRFEYKSSFVSAGNAGGEPRGLGQDKFSGPILAEPHATTNSFSYGSAVYPIWRLSLAIYWHELANYETSVQTNGAFYGPGFPDRHRLFPMVGSIDLRITSVGGAIGFRVSDQFSLGVGVADYGYTQNARVTRYKLSGDLFLSPPDYSAANAASEETVRGDDHAFAFNGGLLWKPSRVFSIGAVYRQGPRFDAIATAKAKNPDVDVLTAPATFHVPDVFGLGIAFSPIEALTITADYDRVMYSQLTNRVVDTRYAGEATGADTTAYAIQDGNEGHLGIQYVIPLGSVALALRAGTWYDPDHQIRYDDISPTSENLVFRGGKAVWHGTGGFGAAFGEHFQIDVAGDYSSTVSIGSVSAVFRF